jgi:translation initiation factor IF-2
MALESTEEKKKTPRKTAAADKAKAASPAEKKPAKKTAAKSAEPKAKPAAPEAAPAEAPKPEPAPAAAAPEPTPAPAEEAAGSKIISMKPPIIVKELAAKLGLKPFQVVHELMEMNVFATLNQSIEEDVAIKVCQAKGFEFQLERREKGGGVHKVEQVIEVPPLKPVVQDASHLSSRPPVIVFMGHVDHGKTSLLDAIRRTKVAAGEAGGITQHIGAYSIERNGHTITFLDTPGHEAFTAMRARGANVTDIAVIVVAADDGLMPQTLEAIQHARAAKVAIMVAINKIDATGAQPDRVKAQLQEIDLAPEDWGGQTIVCEVSATKGTGVEKLLEMMLLQAEVLELKADATCPARGTVIESQIEVGRGPNATIIVQHGTLKVGDPFICGPHWGKVKALISDTGATIKSAGPSTPVKVLGFTGSPVPGEEFTVMRNEREARTVAEERVEQARQGKLTQSTGVTLENLFATIAEGDKKTLQVVLKADVQGSIEAITESLKKIPSDKVDINFLFTGVGPITVNDVLLAKASSNAVIIGFNTRTDNSAATEAKRHDIQIKLYSIIYELIDQVKEAMAGLLDPELRENVVGTALVKKVFRLSKFPVAGCVVQNGRIVKSARARVLRKKQPIYDGGIQTLKRFQDDASEVRSGMECGIRLGNFDGYLEDDIIECYTLEKVAQSL